MTSSASDPASNATDPDSTSTNSGSSSREAADTILLDVDGTLMDSSYHHALAWSRAFRRHDIDLPLWRVHRCIGMGGDMLVPFLLDEATDERIGEALRDEWLTEYQKLLPEVAPLEGASDLVRSLKKQGFTIALASSGGG